MVSHEIEREAQLMEQARNTGIKYEPEKLINEDTPRQLLARCRYPLMKYESQINDVNQEFRLRIAFYRYPELHRAYVTARPSTSIF